MLIYVAEICLSVWLWDGLGDKKKGYAMLGWARPLILGCGSKNQ
uniref:Cellulase n=1 Tax=Neurospora crassa TaxID=5141 RepID=A0A0K2GUU6_NEUCS|nr:cellulase [Neurospora crassa]